MAETSEPMDREPGNTPWTLVHARGGQVSFDGTDLTAVRSALAGLGIHGSPSFDPASSCALPAPDLLDLLEQLRLLNASIAAVEARAITALTASVRRDSTEREEDVAVADGIASREVSLVTGRSPAAASGRIRSSQRLVQGMPMVLTALADGVIDAEKAHTAARVTGPLSHEQRTQVDTAIGGRLPDLVGAGTRQWRREVEALGELVDPDGQDRRHQFARASRNVTLRPREHGMAALTLTLPALEATLARKRLSLEGERLRADGDRRGHSAIMADTAAAALIGRDGPLDPVTLDVGVIITDRALLCPHSAEPAVIEGYGAVPADHLRDALRDALSEPVAVAETEDAGDADNPNEPHGADGADGVDGADALIGADGPALRATLRRLYTHPTSGELVAVESRARAFPRSLSRFLRWRSMTCSGPFCNAEIRHDDHINPHARGGATSLFNGNGLCAHCNGKEQVHLSASPTPLPTRPGRHRVRWTSHYGSTADVVPTPSELASLLHDHFCGADPGAGAGPDRPPSTHRRGSPLTVEFRELSARMWVVPHSRRRPKFRRSDMTRVRGARGRRDVTVTRKATGGRPDPPGG